MKAKSMSYQPPTLLFVFFQDREFVEMGPDALMGGGANAVAGVHPTTGIARLGSPARQFILNRRKWWCCAVRRRKKSTIKNNTVRLFLIQLRFLKILCT